MQSRALAMDLRSKYSLEERIFLESAYYRYDADYNTIFTEFEVKFPNSSVPRRETVYRLIKKFEKHGSVVDAPRSGRPRTATTNENTMYVAQSYVKNPAQSTVRVSGDLGISRRSTARMMKTLGLKVYRPHLLQALNEDNPDRRLEFCVWYVIRTEADPDFFRTVLWSDEAIFKLNGRINRHNCVYWAFENPNLVLQQELNVPGIMV